MSTGRNFDEVLRVIDPLQLTAKHRVSTPANWKQGEDVILGGAITYEEAKKLYPRVGSRRSPISAWYPPRSNKLPIILSVAWRFFGKHPPRTHGVGPMPHGSGPPPYGPIFRRGMK